MAYYDALITKWATLTPGTAAAKLAQLNAILVNGTAVPMVVPTYKIYNMIVASELNALSATNQQLVRDILGMGTVDVSPGTAIRARIISIFPNGTATFTALSAFVTQYDTPQVAWWQANGYPRPFDLGDIAAAGLS